MSRSDAIRRARIERNYSQQELADLVGVSRVAVTKWESDNTIRIEAKNAFALEDHLGLDARALIEGKALQARPPQRVGISPRKLPLYSLSKIGGVGNVIEDCAGAAAQQHVDVDAELSQVLGARAFAVRVEDSSCAPDFLPGDLLIADPALSPRPGDVVIAYLDRAPQAIIRKYRDRGYGRFDLAPINPDYATETVDASNPGNVLGVVVEHRRKLRRN